MSIAVPLSHPFQAAEKHAVTIVPPQAEVSVVQAARILDMAESSILVLLGNGSFQGRQEGGQYWIDRDSLLAYEERCQRRHEWLNELTRTSQEMGLYDRESCDE